MKIVTFLWVEVAFYWSLGSYGDNNLRPNAENGEFAPQQGWASEVVGVGTQSFFTSF